MMENSVSPRGFLKTASRALSVTAFLAALAVGLVFLLPGGLAWAQDDGPIEYAENGTGAVATYTAEDPEGRPVYWSVLASSGTPIDVDGDGTGDILAADAADAAEFSISDGGVLSFNFPPDYENPRGGEGNTNTYRVVVVAADEPLGVADGVMGYEKVTVMVTDEDDPGMITLSAQQPQIGVELTAILTDDDAEDADDNAVGIEAKWKWEYSESAGGPWTPIPPATSATYTPRGVADKYLQVTATYTDEHGSDKPAQVVSPHMVRAAPSNNALPVFPTGSDARSVDENSPPGTRVGDPVAADDAPGDVLTYTLVGDVANDYRIDQATGQITVGPRTMLDREADDTDTVMVTATDPSGAPTDPPQTVTITINDVNEAPMINAGFTRNSQNEGVTVVGTYVATDAESPDCSACTWSVSGTDAGDFEISADDGALTFKEAPDYEMPVDSNRDNEYMVTVVATDAGVDSKNKMTAERDVVVTIMNVDETGTVTLSSEQPKVGIALTAMLEDLDGVVADSVKWTWHKFAALNVNDDNAIEMATSDTYTPEDIGLLSARASYTDGHGASKSVVKAATNLVVANLANVAPKFPDTETGARKVAEGAAAGMPINISATADYDGDDPDLDLVRATDDNVGDILTYMLGGTDMASFDIVRLNGQLQTKAKLDYETKKSYMVTVTATDPDGLSASIDVTIMVTDVDEAPEIAGEDISEEFRENGRNLEIERFRAEDPEGRPVYWSVLASSGTPIDVDGDGTGDILAADAADAAEFSISSSGVLSFKFPPDYENPRGGEENTNTYKVVVVAADQPTGAGSDEMPIMRGYKKVTVSVTNVDETETITLSAERAQVDVELTATYNDLDKEGPSAGEIMWKWYLGGSVIEDAGTSMYTPTSIGSLRVEASYTKTDGSIKKVSKTINVRAAPSNNAIPTFPTGSSARSVDENSPPGTKVGARVAANDEARDTLTYTLVGDVANDYRIDQATGQITVGPRTMLDREADDTDTVMVTATDPSGAPTDPPQTVTITINDVNEAPMINAGFTRNSQNEGVTVVGTYVATDAESPDCSACTWSVSGTDAGDFEISADDGALTFKEAPDYEMPVDSNRDNEYMVTVVATDAGVDSKNKMTAERDVVVTIMNVDETGTVTLSSEQPKVGIALTAMLEDLDGVVADSVKWTWHKFAALNVNDDNAIEMATSDTYTPEDIGLLSARASYTDGHGASKSVVKAATNLVVANLANVAPKFPDTETGARKVAEGAAAGMPINISATADYDGDDPDLDLVRATDDNVGDILTYMLGGTDMASFDIVRLNGQLQTKAKLDYETKKSYMVTVTATDPDGLSASIDVTIMVTDMDEAPMIMLGGLAISGMSSPRFAENGTGSVATYTATGPDADRASWSLEGADVGDFRISSGGMLTFRSSPDYENPMDADMDNMYMVTVKASDGTYMDTHAVMVMVTNVDEDGTVTLSTTSPVVGTELTASLSDLDMVVESSVTWQWARSMDMNSWMDIDGAGARMRTYTPTMDDDDMYLRVTATYTDGHGSGKTEMAMTDNAVSFNAVPEFAAGTDTREVEENAAAGENVGAPVTAMDADNDTLTYSLGGTDMASFTVDNMGQIMVGAGTMLDYETKASYMVTVTASDDIASDSIDVMVMVTNMEEMGEVTLWAGAVALTMAPQVGETITGAVMDPDNPEDDATVESWQWARTMDDMDSRDMDSWMPITGATDAAYMVTEGDTGYYLRVMATYTDAAGTDMAMVYSMPTMMVTITVTDVDEAPVITGDAAPNYAENGTAAVATYSATDPESATITWSLEGDDAALFDLSSGGVLTFGSPPDYENPADADPDNVYKVTVKASDGTNEDTLDVTVTVTDVDEDVAPADPLKDKYDANDNDAIERSEVFAAINDYLEGDAGAPTRVDVFRLIDLYLGD